MVVIWGRGWGGMKGGREGGREEEGCGSGILAEMKHFISSKSVKQIRLNDDYGGLMPYFNVILYFKNI